MRRWRGVEPEETFILNSWSGIPYSHHEESDLGENTLCDIYLNHLIEKLARIPETGEQLDSTLDEPNLKAI